MQTCRVTVAPALQLSEDVRQLGLSQQRARGLIEWLAPRSEGDGRSAAAFDRCR
jgi:hypothetical protein